jgi:autotransporter-associated beta strand protein
MCKRIRQNAAPGKSSAIGGRGIFIAVGLTASAWGIAARGANLTWDNHLADGGDGVTWDNGSGGASRNWVSAGAPADFTQGSSVTFNDSNNGNYAVDLASNVLPASVTVSGAGNYVIDSAEGFCIADYLTPTTLTQSGGGRLTIANFNTYTGATTISGSGTMMHLASSGALATGQLNVSAGASAEIDGIFLSAPTLSAAGSVTFGEADGDNNPGAGFLIQTLSSISIATTGKVATTPSTDPTMGTLLATSGVTIDGAGQLELSNNDMLIAYAGASPAGTIRGYLRSGYNYGAWNGSGIISSAGHASGAQGLGYAEAADLGATTFDGQSVAGNALIVKFTYLGDSTLDGSVDLGNDFNLFLQGFLGAGSDWEHGDYNYDGHVDVADFHMFIDGYSQQGGTLGDLTEVIEHSPLSANQKAALASFVPDPTGGALAFGGFAIGLTSLCRRGSRRRR